MQFEKRPPRTYEIFGKSYNVALPTVGQMEDFMSQRSKLDEIAQVSFVRTWLEKLGLPQDISKDLYMDQLTDIIEDITGSKKK